MILIEISQKIIVIREAVGFVGWLSGITKVRNNFAGFFGENLGRIFRMDPFEAVLVGAYGCEEKESQDHCGEARKGDAWREGSGFTRCGDRLRGGGLSGSERRGQRV